MINIAYLVKCLESEALEDLIANIEAAPIDMNLAIWAAIDKGEVEIDEEKGTVKLLKDPQPSSNEDLANKILRTIQHYSREETNITRGRLNSQVKDLSTGKGYAWHDYVTTVQCLIDIGIIEQEVIEVPPITEEKVMKSGRKRVKVLRPGHKFAFLGLAENSKKNKEWNAAAVDKWIADMDKHMVK